MTPEMEAELKRLVEVGGSSYKMSPRVSGHAQQLKYVVRKNDRWTITEMGRAALRARIKENV